MRLKVDKESDALYLRLDEAAVVESEEVQPRVVLDYDAADNVVGVEILNLSKRVAPERLRVLRLEDGYGATLYCGSAGRPARCGRRHESRHETSAGERHAVHVSTLTRLRWRDVMGSLSKNQPISCQSDASRFSGSIRE